MPFNALTNRFPRIEIPTACGITIPKTAPMIMPPRIRLGRLMAVQRS